MSSYFKIVDFPLLLTLQLLFASNTLMLALGKAILWGLVELIAMNSYGAKLLANGTTFVANYAVRAALFRRK